MTVQELLSRAEQAEQRLEWSLAAQFYRQAMELSPDDQSIKGRLAWCLSRDKRYLDAMVQLRDLVDSQPQIAKWPYMMGYQYHEQQKWKEAIEWYDRALALKPDYIVALYRKGYA